ncbi:hypothetical protein RHS01_04904 [Rhizoctonia solani]|uniref:CCHC-type domain-containing protein n=1 Tax=Rhizoctonia solani TaxID=456999 RepID=A0A8H7IEF6_9AGAM|nr:hypothetical protein RHS01_04904 [Rhizoctonia solani]
MLSTMFQWHCATAQQVYDKAEEIANHIESTRLSNPSVSAARTSSNTVSTLLPTPLLLVLALLLQLFALPLATCQMSGGMENQGHNDPIPSLKKDERPAAAAPVKTIIAPTPILALNSKGPGPMDLDGRGFSNLTCHVCSGKGHFARSCPSKPMSGHVANVEWSWERPKEENRIKVVSDEEELGKGKAKAN